MRSDHAASDQGHATGLKDKLGHVPDQMSEQAAERAEVGTSTSPGQTPVKNARPDGLEQPESGTHAFAMAQEQLKAMQHEFDKHLEHQAHAQDGVPCAEEAVDMLSGASNVSLTGQDDTGEPDAQIECLESTDAMEQMYESIAQTMRTMQVCCLVTEPELIGAPANQTLNDSDGAETYR